MPATRGYGGPDYACELEPEAAWQAVAEYDSGCRPSSAPVTLAPLPAFPASSSPDPAPTRAQWPILDSHLTSTPQRIVGKLRDSPPGPSLVTIQRNSEAMAETYGRLIDGTNACIAGIVAGIWAADAWHRHWVGAAQDFCCPYSQADGLSRFYSDQVRLMRGPLFDHLAHKLKLMRRHCNFQRRAVLVEAASNANDGEARSCWSQAVEYLPQSLLEVWRQKLGKA